jgi:hypothetical protein
MKKEENRYLGDPRLRYMGGGCIGLILNRVGLLRMLMSTFTRVLEKSVASCGTRSFTRRALLHGVVSRCHSLLPYLFGRLSTLNFQSTYTD